MIRGDIGPEKQKKNNFSKYFKMRGPKTLDVNRMLDPLNVFMLDNQKLSCGYITRRPRVSSHDGSLPYTGVTFSDIPLMG